MKKKADQSADAILLLQLQATAMVLVDSTIVVAKPKQKAIHKSRKTKNKTPLRNLFFGL